MQRIIKRTHILLLTFILCFLAGCANGKKDNDFTKEFIPALENTDLEFRTEFVSEGELHLVGANVDSFEQCIELLKEIGYVFDTNLNKDEESMINMQLWQGKNENYNVVLYLMIDLKDNTGASDYVKVCYNLHAD